MKKLFVLLLALVVALGLLGCGQKTSTWEEQYDLGVRYLSEGNYEEAILAFNAAIEIDPKRPEAYVGLAKAYTAQGDPEKAAEVLTRAEEACGESDVLTAAWEELGLSPGDEEETAEPAEASDGTDTPAASEKRTERVDLDNGGYFLLEYDENGEMIRMQQYEADETLRFEETFYSDGVRKTTTLYPLADDFPSEFVYEEYDSFGRLTLCDQEESFGSDSSYRRTVSYTYSGAHVSVLMNWVGVDVLSFEYDMEKPTNYIMIVGCSMGKSDGLDDVEVVEYALEGHDTVIHDDDGVEVARTTYHGDGKSTPAA